MPRRQAEQEEILVADFLADFDVGAVQGADGHGAVHHELHVAGARRFLAGGGNLLGQIGAGADDLHRGDPIVGQESQLQLVADLGVVVDDLGDVVGQLDDLLGHVVAGGRLAADQYAARSPVGGIAALDAVVQVDDVQQVQQLALVLVHALDLHVEHGLEVEDHATVGFDQAGQTDLVILLDFPPARPEFGVVGMRRQFAQLVQLGDPAGADGFGDQRAHAGVATGHPAPLGDPVGLVVELLRPQFVEVAEQPLLEQLRMQRGHAVDRDAADDGQIGHADLLFVTFLDQRHPALTVDVAGPVAGDLGQEAGVDFVNDVQQPG